MRPAIAIVSLVLGMWIGPPPVAKAAGQTKSTASAVPPALAPSMPPAIVLLVTVHHPANWNAALEPGEWRCQVGNAEAVWDEACHQKAIRFASRAGLDDFLSKTEVADGELLAISGPPKAVTQKPVYRPKRVEEVDHYQVELR